MKRPEKPGVDTTSFPVKRDAMALGQNLFLDDDDDDDDDDADADVLEILDKIVFQAVGVHILK